MSVLLDIDPLSGALEEMSYDHTTGKLTIRRTENVQAVLDANEAVRNGSDEAWRGADNTMWHVASIPMTVLQGWLKEFNLPRPRADKVLSPLDPNEDWQTFMWRRLQSSEYYKFKLTPKNL